MEKPPESPPKPEQEPSGRKVYAWCKKDMGPAETERDSHGICEECIAKNFPKEKEYILKVQDLARMIYEGIAEE